MSLYFILISIPCPRVVHSSECWVCSNGFLRLIQTKERHEFIIQLHGESMTYSSTLLDSSYQINAYFFHHDLQLVRAVNTKQLPDWEQAPFLAGLFLLNHLTAKKLIPTYFTLVGIFLLTGQMKWAHHSVSKPSSTASVHRAWEASVLVSYQLQIKESYIRREDHRIKPCSVSLVA